MPEASFYILPSQSLSDRLLFACKLIEKAYRCGQFCYVYTETLQHSQQLDDLLWTYRENSFIPHQVYDEPNKITPEYEHTVLIGTQKAPEKWQKLIFNLSSKYPDNINTAERVLEILDNNEELKQAGRERFRRYKQAEFKISTYKI